MQKRLKRGTSLLIAVIGLALGLIAPVARAQHPDDWTAPYVPALLPAYVGEMAAHADAPRYVIELALALTPEEATLTGAQTVRYTNRASVPLESVVFRLYPNLESYGGSMAVPAVRVGEQPVRATLDATLSVLTVPLPAPLEPGASVRLAMDFTATVTAGTVRHYAQYSYLDGVLALPNAYPVLSVCGPGGAWWDETDHPDGDAVFSETAFYTVRLTAPADLIVAASGSEVDLAFNADGTLTHHYVAPLMRDFALFASLDYVGLAGEQDGTRINVYYDPAYPAALDTARAALTITQNAVRVYNATFGRYPFAELDVLQTPTNAGGIEYPGVFVIGVDVWNQADEFFKFVIAHEAAHQWWYSLVGNDQARHPWVDEALAQYSVALYIRDLEGEAAYYAALEAFRAAYEGYHATHQDQPLTLPVAAYPGPAYFYMIYQKGPLFYAALDDVFGTERVTGALAELLAAHRYGIVTPPDVLAGLEASLETDLDGLYERWVGPVPVG